MKALIIGGGMAGPVTAMALRQAGIDAAVYEAYDRAADGVGAFLTLAVNGLAALRELGLNNLVRDKGFDTPAMVAEMDGRRLVEFSFGEPLPDGTYNQTITRADLYGVLRDEAVRRGVPIEYGKRLVSAESTGGGVTATFADGSTATGDLLIGADGLRSVTRTIIDPDAPAPRYVPLLNAGGYARGVELPGEPGVMHMFFGRRCFFSYVKRPDGEVWWFANPPQPKELTAAELAAITPARWRANLHDLFAGDDFPAGAVIDATEHIFSGWNTYDFPKVPGLAPRPHDHHRRRGARHLTRVRPGRVDGAGGRGDAGEVPAGPARRARRVRRLRGPAPHARGTRGGAGQAQRRRQGGRPDRTAVPAGRLQDRREGGEQAGLALRPPHRLGRAGHRVFVTQSAQRVSRGQPDRVPHTGQATPASVRSTQWRHGSRRAISCNPG